MDDWQLYLALVLCLAVGFFLGLRQAKKNNESLSESPSTIDPNYFKGLNFLLNEQPDAAIDAFIGALEVNSETLETHLALGNLLRKRGEVDRAIRIHQNLLARPGLTIQNVQQVQYELATDFAKAGLFDRAESLLKTLVEYEGDYKVLGLKRLLEVYQDEKEWQKGLDVLQELSGSRLSRSYDEYAKIRAHFCCELAENFLSDSNYKQSIVWVKQALIYEKESVRAGLLLSRLEFEDKNYQKSIILLKKIIHRFPEYIGGALPLLSKSYFQLNQNKEYQSYLYELDNMHQIPLITVELSELIAKNHSKEAAASYVAKKVTQYPSGVGLHKLLDYYLVFTEGKTHDYLSSLKQVMDRVVGQNSSYQCGHCGFKAKRLHWLCPSCKTWGNLKLKNDP